MHRMEENAVEPFGYMTPSLGMRCGTTENDMKVVMNSL